MALPVAVILNAVLHGIHRSYVGHRLYRTLVSGREKGQVLVEATHASLMQFCTVVSDSVKRFQVSSTATSILGAKAC